MERRAPSGGSQAHSSSPVAMSYLCPVRPASKLLHDGLISLPVVQPRHILAIGPRAEKKVVSRPSLSHDVPLLPRVHSQRPALIWQVTGDPTGSPCRTAQPGQASEGFCSWRIPKGSPRLCLLCVFITWYLDMTVSLILAGDPTVMELKNFSCPAWPLLYTG